MRRGAIWRGARNQELDKLRHRIEELYHRRNGDVKVDSKLEEEKDAEERDPTIRLISYFSNNGSSWVNVSCYDGNLRCYVLID